MSPRYAGGAAAVERLVRSFLVLRTAPSGVQALGTARREAVVICLSQRLSHACLSISNLYCETANGSLNQLSFI
ncbi:hypothetical protein N7499_012192 [Penicillium canescens]|nr:hypothetical protein N7499_012192 [Penicillium canescens]